MQIVCSNGLSAECKNGDQQEWVDLSLLGEQPTGTWVLVFLGAAREALTPERAAEVQQALAAVRAVMHGESADIESCFADLIERPPQLPPHLQNNN